MKELASNLLDLMKSLCETERGRLAVAVLKYIATGEKEEPRGTERVFFEQAIKMVDVQLAQNLHNIDINNKDLSVQPSLENSSNTSTFDTFWNTYPKGYRTNKKRCLDIWKRIKPDQELLDKIVKSIEAWKKTRQWQDGYVPNPDTFLRNEKWNDETPPPAQRNRNAALSYEQTPISKSDWDNMIVDL